MRQRQLLIMSLLAVAIMLCGGRALAQSYLLSEDFEQTAFPPGGWTTVDADGDGHCWQRVGKGSATLNGTGIAVSYSVNPQTGKTYGTVQDNWLITPQISVTNASFKLAYKCCAEDEDSEEPYEVLVSETGTAPADFTHTLVSTTLSNGYDGVELQSVQRSLAAFAGKKIYIAFRYTGLDNYALGIDDVTVSNEKGPCVPTLLTVTAGTGGQVAATLQWTNPSADATGAALTGLVIDVFRDGTLIATVSDAQPGQTSQYVDSKVASGNHTYAVAARTAEGSSQLVQKTAYVGEDVPAAVGSLTVTPSDGHNIIGWTAPTTGNNKGFINPANLVYDVWRVKADGTREQAADGIAALTFSDTPEPGQLLAYAVAARNDAGTGPETVSGQVIAYDASLKDFNLTPAANADYKNPKIPFDLSVKAAVTQVMLYPSDLYGAHGTISDIVLGSSLRTAITKPVRVWMGETDEPDLSKGWFATSSLKLVYDGEVAMAAGLSDVPLHLSTPYSYTGKNLVVFFSQEPSTGTGSYFDRFLAQNTDKANRTRTYTSYSADGIDVDGIDANEGDLSSYLPALRVVIDAEGVAGLSGVVKSAATGAAIEGAAVTLDGTGLTTTSQAGGAYSFYAVQSGKHTLTASAPGYDDLTVSVDMPQRGEVTRDLELSERAMVTVSGTVTLQGVGAVAGVGVALSGYSEAGAVTTADGSFSLRAYKGAAYTLTVSSPLFDSYVKTFDAIDADAPLGSIELGRSVIAPYGVSAQVSADGSSVALSWQAPDSRVNATRWTRWKTSDTNDGLGGDGYYATDFNVAHAFTAQDIKDSCMVGLSFTKVRAYVKGGDATLEAKVWRGTRDDHTELASAPISVASDFEGWVTVDLPEPVEIREGEDYMIGVHCANAGSEVIGHGPSYSKVTGKNCLRFTDAEGAYTYDYYYAWNLSAECGVPGSKGVYGQPVATLPQPSYTVYRTVEGSDERQVVTTAAAGQPLAATDAAWASLRPGTYHYAVTAVYDGAGTSQEALSAAVGRHADTDAGVEAIVSPERTVGMQSAVEVKVRIANYGEKPISNVPVKVTVDAATTLSTVYAGTLTKGQTADVTVGQAELAPDTHYIITAATALEGDEIAGDDAATLAVSNYPDVELTGFRWDAYGDAGVMTIHANVPEKATFVKEVTPDDNLLQAGEYAGGKFYGFTGTWSGSAADFVAMSTDTWTPTFSAYSSRYVTDMTYDYTTDTMYALALLDGDQALCTVDLATGECTSVGVIDKSYFALACNSEGQLYAIDGAGVLYRLDKQTGAATTVGDTGVGEVKYLQSMTFDRRTNRLFWAHSNAGVSGRLYELSTATGAAVDLGQVIYDGYPTEIVALSIAAGQTPTGIGAAQSGAATSPSAYADALRAIHADAQLAAGQTMHVTVCTASGAVVADVTTASGSSVVASGLAEGVYVVRMAVSDGRRASVKVVVR